MKAFAALLLAVVLVTGLTASFAADAPKPDAAADQKALQGTWTITSAETRGQKTDEIIGSTMVFADDKITLKLKGKDEAKEATYKLDPSAKPRQLTLTPADKEGTLQGIYELDGDNLKICMADNDKEARPDKFETAEGKKSVLLVLKREKK